MNSIIKKTVILFIGTGIKIVLAILADRYIAINLNPDIFGSYKYYITILTVAFSITGLGLNTGIVKELSGLKDSHHKQKKILIFAFLVTIISSIIFVLLFKLEPFIHVAGIPNPSEFRIIVFSLIPLTLNQFLISVLSINHNSTAKVLVNDILLPLLFFGFILFFFRLEKNLTNVVLSYLIAQYTTCLVNILISFKSFYKSLSVKGWSKASLRPLIKYCIPVFFTNILVGLATQVDKIVLNVLVTQTALGIYYSVAILSNLLGLILSTLVFLYLPLASSTFNRHKFKAGGLVSSYISKWLMLFAFIPFWLLFNYSESVIEIFYNKEYMSGVRILPVLALAQFINLSAGFTGQNLLAMGDSKGQFVIRVFGFIISIGLSILLGKYFNEIGVAFAVLISLVTTNSMQVLRIKWKFNVRIYNANNLIGLIMIVVMILFFKSTNKLFPAIHPLGLFAINAVIYSVALILVLRNRYDKKALRISQKLLLS